MRNLNYKKIKMTYHIVNKVIKIIIKQDAKIITSKKKIFKLLQTAFKSELENNHNHKKKLKKN